MLFQLIAGIMILTIICSLWMFFEHYSKKSKLDQNSVRTAEAYKSKRKNNSVSHSMKTAGFVVLILINSMWLFFKTKASKNYSANNSPRKVKKLLEEERNNMNDRPNEAERLEAIFSD